MAVRHAVCVMAAVAASVALLAGCAPEPEMPAPMTEADANRLIADRNSFLWNTKFPGEPMPVVDPVEIQPVNGPDLTQECYEAAGVVRVDAGDGSWTAVTDGSIDQDTASRVVFTCFLQYPIDTANPGAYGLLTDEERSWIWTYTQTRLVPCLQLMGYDVANREGGYVKDLAPFWSPYTELQPAPTTAADWEQIDFTCPPSPIGPLVRPAPEDTSPR